MLIGRDLSPAAIVSGLLAGNSKREAITFFCEEVIGQKEMAERGRERADGDRRRRRCCRPLTRRQHD